MIIDIRKESDNLVIQEPLSREQRGFSLLFIVLIGGIVLFYPTLFLHDVSFYFSISLAILFLLLPVRVGNSWMYSIFITYLLGYIGKAIYMMPLLNNYDELLFISLDWLKVSYEQLNEAVNISLESFIITMIIALFFYDSSPDGDVHKSLYYNTKLIYLVASPVILYSIYQIYTGSSMMGVEVRRSLFLTINNRYKGNIFPALMTYFYWISGSDKKRRRRIIGLLIVIGILDVIARGTKGGFSILMNIVFLELVINKKRVKYIKYVVLLLCSIAILSPFALLIRASNMSGRTSIESFVYLVKNIDSSNIDFSDISNIISRTIFRTIGVDSLAMIMPYLSRGFDFNIKFLADPIGYFTKDIVGVLNANDYRSPGFLGSIYLAFGLYGGGIFLSLYIVALGVIARKMNRLRTRPVAIALFCVFIFSNISESVFSYENYIAFFLSILSIEVAHRIIEKKIRILLHSSGAMK